MNHLANESSPYLLQHRDNPVDWFPWGDEAFEKARETDRPIFLSIGYATCHWCHVMEHESFADAEVASLMNRWFVSIKVDREERPDIDNIYMTVCQLMGGHCGWPLNVVLTPDRRPFFVATYVPKTNRQGRVGMLDLLPRLAAAWSERRVDVDGAAQEVTEALRSIAAPAVGSVRLESGTLVKARDELGQRFDDRYGGFGGAPKFPSSHNLLFLLRYAQRTGDDEARQWAVKTLRSIRFGGIFDQIGYGVHRYSTDASWTVPHFEKMLYDQALHVLAYAECFLATGDQLYRRTALQVAEYVLRDLTSKEGAFFSAEDADSEGVEGKFYVWSTEEIRQVLGPDADHVLSILQMRDEGNFHDEATGQLTATNIPYLGSTGESFALATDDRLEAARQKLLRHRARRPRPLLDDKILTDWNGLMIGALAFAGRALGESRLIDAAIQASHFALEVMYTPEGLLHRYRNGDAGIRGHLDDYAFLCYGLTELYQATLDTRHLSSAVSLLDDSLDVFWDGESGGFFLAAAERTDLLVRNKDFNDGAIPSGNSVALLNLIRLERITGRASYGDKADEMLRVAAPTVVRYPSAYTGLLLGLEFLRAPSETVLVGDRDHEELRSMREALNERYLPSNVVLWADGAGSTLAALAPHVANYMRDMDGEPRAYVCRNYVCASPASSVSEMLERFTDLA